MMRKRHLIMIKLDLDRGGYPNTTFAETLSLALDWIQMSPGMWIVYTSSSSKKWYERFQKRIADKSRIFIIEINPQDRAGRWSSDVWAFIKGKQEKMQESANGGNSKAK